MLRITWVGHSTVLIELDGVRLLTDPVLRGRLAHLRRVAARVDPAALERLDAVLVSHMHYDHLDLPLGREPWPLASMSCVPAGSGRLLRRRGFTRVSELDVGEELDIEAVTVAGHRSRAQGKRNPFGARHAHDRLPRHRHGPRLVRRRHRPLRGDERARLGPRRRAAPDLRLGPAAPTRPPRPASRRAGAAAASPAGCGADPLGHLPADRSQARGRGSSVRPPRPSRSTPPSWRPRWTSGCSPWAVAWSSRRHSRTGASS